MLLTEIKYQIFRNKGRSVLLLCVAAAFFTCLVFYAGNILSTEAALDHLAETVSVKVRVTSRNGELEKDLHVDSAHFDAFCGAGVREVVCTAKACGAYNEWERQVDPFVGGDTTILATNTLVGFGGVPEAAFELEQGHDLSFLSSAENFCVVDSLFGSLNGIAVGDTVTLPIHLVHWESGIEKYASVGDVTMQVIGTFDTAQAVEQSISFYVSTGWLRKVCEENGVGFSYSSLQALVDDPLELNRFKKDLAKAGFMIPFADAFDPSIGDAAYVDDEQFVKAAEQLKETIQLYNDFKLPFYALIVLLVLLVTFLVLKNSQSEMAVASSLGQPKSMTFSVYFLSILLIYAVNCLVALPILYLTAEVALFEVMKTCGAFLLFSALGASLALTLLLRFDTLSLLTKTD